MLFLMILLPFYSLACFLVRIQRRIHVTHKVCVHCLPVRLTVKSQLLVKLGGGSQNDTWIVDHVRGGRPSPWVVQGSNAHRRKQDRGQPLDLLAVCADQRRSGNVGTESRGG